MTAKLLRERGFGVLLYMLQVHTTDNEIKILGKEHIIESLTELHHLLSWFAGIYRGSKYDGVILCNIYLYTVMQIEDLNRGTVTKLGGKGVTYFCRCSVFCTIYYCYSHTIKAF